MPLLYLVYQKSDIALENNFILISSGFFFFFVNCLRRNVTNRNSSHIIRINLGKSGSPVEFSLCLLKYGTVTHETIEKPQATGIMHT